MPKKATKSSAKKAKTKKISAPNKELTFEEIVQQDPALSKGAAIQSQSPVGDFHVLKEDSANTVNSAIELMKNWAAKRKGVPTTFKTLAEVRLEFLTLPHFALQYLVGAIGIRYPGFCEFIAKESTGKTTLSFYLASAFMDLGCPIVYFETEGKPMPEDRASRVMSASKRVGDLKASRILWDQVFDLNSFEERLFRWINTLRGRNNTKDVSVFVPKNTPIVVIVDSWSKLMSKRLYENFIVEEAQAVTDSKRLSKKSEKAKKASSAGINASGEGSTFEHAKWAQDFSKRMPAFLTANNVLLFCIEHQNDKVSMSAGGRPGGAAPSFIPEEAMDLRNKTRIGGRAFNQNAQTQFIGAPYRQIKHGDVVVGKEIKLRVEKNSFGAESRQIRASIYWEHPTDSGDYQSPAISFDNALCDILMDHDLVDITLTAGLYSSRTLGVAGATAEQVSAAFHSNIPLMNKCARILKIKGYDTTADAVVNQDESLLPPDDSPNVRTFNTSPKNIPVGLDGLDEVEEEVS